jgi:hypothetical protein
MSKIWRRKHPHIPHGRLHISARERNYASNEIMGHYSGYTAEDFKHLLDVLEKVEGKFMLSTCPSDILHEYVNRNSWQMLEISMHKSAGCGSKTEVLTMNYNPNYAKQGSLFDL